MQKDKKQLIMFGNDSGLRCHLCIIQSMYCNVTNITEHVFQREQWGKSDREDGRVT